ncbi:putative oxidoreductase YrbE [Holospora obtusa F1]|uniref:Oxidoreductase YrbE n=1 Tax=Holospora obtusa F1 TaxID=1399147 RepID=W6TDQ2_HOLOB|nr:Gfo/Idh/MocA family oxidoreductase [Holospora obtusa]ETZ07213.1 putative oxidoreductase YrbE [Holospora obtusa F1]
MIAIIGCGLWGMNIVRTLSEMKILSAICDADSARCAQVSQKFHVPILTFSEILTNQHIKGVVLSVPACKHVEMASAVLNAGKHVWIEKPMALTLNDAQHVFALAQEKNLQILVGHVVRYHGAFEKMLLLIHSGEIGNILYIDCVRQNWGRVCPEEKDVLWSLAVHDISLVLALMLQSFPVKVMRYVQSCVQGGDQGMLLLKFETGVQARITSSWCYPIKEQRCVVTGIKGSVVFDDTRPDGEELYIVKHDISKTRPFLSSQEIVAIAYDYRKQPLTRQCEAFINAISSGVSVPTCGLEALSGIKILSSAEEIIL